MIALLRDQLRHAPDPGEARRWLDRLLEAGLPDVEDGPVLEVARIACAVTPYLAMLAARDPGRLVAAAHDPYLQREKPASVMRVEIDAATAGAKDGKELSARLRGYRAREIIRLGARERGLGDPAEVGRELSHLADVAVDAALRFHDAELAAVHGEPRYTDEAGVSRRAGLVVFGMGKLGGEELNFSSDIDVIYLYSSDAGAAGKLSLHEYFDLLARRLTRTIGEVTEDDVVFRVDLRLRPEGGRGPLVNSLESAERYYESWGRAWERQAWLKARACAGDLSLGAEALAALAPFIYPRHTSPSVIRDVEELNRRIKAELDATGLGAGYDVKTGYGGIREIEFFVQALQLVHAGKTAALRERSTRGALEKLFFAGLIAERERRALADSYDFLRQIEHLLQLESGRQTHRLPTDHAALEVLARRLGCADAGELTSRLKLHTESVADIFATLGSGAEPAITPEIALLLSPDSGAAGAAAETEAALARLGFRDPEAAAFQLGLLRRKPFSPLGPSATEAGARLAPALLRELAASPDPDQALRFLVDYVGFAFHGVWTLLDANRPLLRLIASLFGTSAFLARTFAEHPELTDSLLLRRPRRHRADLDRAVDDRLKEVVVDDEGGWNALRRVKNEEVLRIGLSDIAGELDLDDVNEQLSDLADVCVARTFGLVRTALERRYGRLAPMAVLALGKHGGRELGYASDLDLVFVYDGGLDDHEVMTKLAQRLVNALAASLEEGRLYGVDTRLRPSGQRGTLVSSLTAWRIYHTSAALWERQALIKLRAVAGDPVLGRTIEAEALRHVYAGTGSTAGDQASIRAEIARMRERIEKELAPKPHGPGGQYDIKTGRGGLLDVEFAAQYLQLVHGPAMPPLRVRSTLLALERAAELGVLDAESHATFTGGYRFLRLLEHRLRIVHDRPIHELPKDGDELDKLARRTGLCTAPALLRAYLHWTEDVRASYLKLLYTTP